MNLTLGRIKQVGYELSGYIWIVCKKRVLRISKPQLNKIFLSKGFDHRGAALITVLTIIFILMILSSVMLSLVSNQTRIVEHNIARIKARYATEATMVRELERARKNTAFESISNVSGKYDNESLNWEVDVSSGVGAFPNTTELNLSLNYSIL